MTTACYPSYPSLEQFYDWRGGRHSGEADFGWFNWDDAITPDPGKARRTRAGCGSSWSTTPATCTPWTTAVRARYCCWVLSNNIGPGSRWNSAWLIGLRATARAGPSPGSVNASPA